MDAPARPHTLSLNDRKTLTLTGVSEVTSFDEKQLVLHTGAGLLTVTGEGLHVSALLLEEGKLSVEGQIDAVAYSRKGFSRKGLRGLLS
ncbi:MAG: sporulation protein YabP [Clostridia bacterium]|nr:sporulation protein YabP [Clostridia bacterium]